MIQRIWAVIQKEFIQTFRDMGTLLIEISIPVIQLILFGYAINMAVDHVPMVVADQSLDAASRAYVEAMTSSGFFDVVAYVPDQAEATRLIDSGRARAGIVIPPDFASKVARGDAQVLLLIDGADLFTSQSAYNAAVAIAEVHATKLLVNQIARQTQIATLEGLLPFQARIRILYNPNLSDLWFIIPSMLAMLLQTQAISLTASAVVREREVGTIEQILVTPLRSGEFLLGKIVPNLFIAMINMVTIVGLAVYWFKVPFQGNFWSFLWLSFMYVFSGLGLGLLISILARNQKQAQQMLITMMLLGVVLGGFIFPRYAMPPVLRWAGNLFPLTYFIPIARGIVTKGVSIDFLWGQVAALLVHTLIIVLAAIRAFKPRLE